MRNDADFTIALETDFHIIITDNSRGRPVPSDAASVIHRINDQVGGIGRRRVIFRDPTGRYDELEIKNGHFAGIRRCSIHQQEAFRLWLDEHENPIAIQGNTP